MTSAPPPDLERLAQLALARRRHLGLTVTAITAKVGLSKDTYGRIEKAQPVTASSYAKAERALGWSAGSVRDVLAGGEPLPVRIRKKAATAPGRVSAADINSAVTSAVVAVVDNVTPMQIREIARLAAAELARHGLLAGPEEEGGST